MTLEEPTHCPSCGAPVPPGNAYCPSCGSTLYSRPAIPDRSPPQRRYGLGSDPISSWVVFIIGGGFLAVIGAYGLAGAAYAALHKQGSSDIYAPLEIGIIALLIFAIVLSIFLGSIKKR